MPPHPIRFDHIIFKRYAFRIVLRKPCFRSVDVREHLEMIGVTDLLARVDVDEDCRPASASAGSSDNEFQSWLPARRSRDCMFGTVPTYRTDSQMILGQHLLFLT